MTRRHRIHVDELEPVFEAITDQLAVVAATHDADMLAAVEHIHLFRIWWRIKEGREGKPSYPNPITYGTIRNHVGTITHSNDGELSFPSPPGEPQPVTVLGTSEKLRAGVNLGPLYNLEADL